MAQVLYEGVVNAAGFYGACGQAAYLAILHAVKGVPLSKQELLLLINQGTQGHQIGGSGSTTPANLTWLAQQQGVPLTSIGADLTSIDAALPNGYVILGLGNARALGGLNLQENVSGHYVTLVSQEGDNYQVADPNSVASETGQLATYTGAQLQAAQPFWAATAPVTPGTQENITLQNPLDAVAAVGQFLNDIHGVVSWIGDPIRILKVLIGLGLIGIALDIAFLRSPAAKTVVEALGGQTGNVADVIRAGALGAKA
jgi:hypothetical protein